MSKESICQACGCTLDPQFIFCPCCGSPTDPDCFLAERFDPVFERIQNLQVRWTQTRIARMEHDLSEIDRCLSEIVPVSETLYQEL